MGDLDYLKAPGWEAGWYLEGAVLQDSSVPSLGRAPVESEGQSQDKDLAGCKS